jgi:hypothetical protein
VPDSPKKGPSSPVETTSPPEATRTPTNLREAVAAIQERLAANPLSKSRKVDTGKFSYSYVPLDDVMAAISKACAPYGVYYAVKYWGTEPNMIRLEVGWGTTDEVMVSEMPMPASATSQELGGFSTYRKRYILCSFFGIVGEEDDDAAAEEEAAKGKGRASAKPSGICRFAGSWGRQGKPWAECTEKELSSYRDAIKRGVDHAVFGAKNQKELDGIDAWVAARQPTQADEAPPINTAQTRALTKGECDALLAKVLQFADTLGVDEDTANAVIRSSLQHYPGKPQSLGELQRGSAENFAARVKAAISGLVPPEEEA